MEGYSVLFAIHLSGITMFYGEERTSSEIDSLGLALLKQSLKLRQSRLISALAMSAALEIPTYFKSRKCVEVVCNLKVVHYDRKATKVKAV